MHYIRNNTEISNFNTKKLIILQLHEYFRELSNCFLYYDK